MEDDLMFEIRQFTKAKGKIYAHTSEEEENNFILYFPSAKPCLAVSWRVGLQDA